MKLLYMTLKPECSECMENHRAHGFKKKKKTSLGQLFQTTFQTELWPPRFPYLNLCNYYLWRTLKDRVYVNNLFFAISENNI